MTKQIITQALQYLAGVCNFASTRDNSGFNKFDADFGHQLAEQTLRGEELRDGQAAAALKMMKKYRNQLLGAGIELPQEFTFSPVVTDQKLTVELNNQIILIKFSGRPDPELLEIVRALPERRWKPEMEGKPWIVPARFADQVVAALEGKAEISTDLRKSAEWVFAHKAEVSTPTVKTIQFKYDGKMILVQFPGRPSPEELTLIKSLPERKWEPKMEGMPWSVPVRFLQDLIKMFPSATIDPALAEIAKNQIELTQMSRKASSDFEVEGLKGTLLPFQKAGAEFLDKAEGRAILADEMGLGKTIQALAYMQLHPELRPCVIVVPASLKINWKREADRWLTTKDRFVILSGTKAHDFDLLGATVAIINYDILSSWVEKIETWKPALIIADEAHYAKNPKTSRTKALHSLAKSTRHFIALTGTPLTNRPSELFPLLNMVDPYSWPNFFKFAQRYCDAVNDGFGWNFSGASNLQELHERIKPYVVRRVKADVLKELPEKRHATVVIDFNEKQAQDYRAVLDGTIQAIEDSGAKRNPVNVLAKIERAKQAAVYGKMDAAISWIENFLSTNGKLVVFCTHQFVIDRLMTEFKDQAVCITGEITGQARQDAVDAFQGNEKVRLMVGNIKAAGVGITLTAASDVAFIEFPWTPGDLAQATDRCHRIGQKSSVTAWYLVADGTFEEDIVDLLQAKAKVIGQVHDGDENAMDINILGELCKSLERFSTKE